MCDEYVLVGNGTAPGIAIGIALVYRPYRTMTYGFRSVQAESHATLSVSAYEEVQRLDEAIAAANTAMVRTMEQLRAEGKAAESLIFEEHRALLNSPTLYERALVLINKAGWRASEAIAEAGEQEATPFDNPRDPYLLAHAASIRDSVRQLRHILLKEQTLADRLIQPCIIVAEDLGLSEWIHVPRAMIQGIVLSSGGTTAHAIIMARSLGIPTIIGLGAQLKELEEGTLLAMDGTTGRLIVSPSEATVTEIQTHAAEEARRQTLLRSQRDMPPITRDGHKVKLLANAATVVEAQTAREWGAQGIGSLRTEMLFLGRRTLPNEEEQLSLYAAIAAELPGCPIAARTLDIGGDKYLPAFPMPGENNPFLGWRGIRIGLSEPEKILKPQLRAMLRAGAHAPIQIVIPMIATVQELRQVRVLLHQAHEELLAEGKPCCERPKLGVMIEIPSAAIEADVLARESDFLSIGTNDLVQYTLACDRTNQRVAELSQPLEPAVLRLIHWSVEAAHRYSLSVSVCGEMASDPTMTALLIGMGVDELSCVPTALPLVRAAVRATVAEHARDLARRVLSATCLGEVQTLMQHYYTTGETH